MSGIRQNIEAIEQEILWFSSLLQNRFQSYFENTEFQNPAPPDLSSDDSTYASLIKKHNFGKDERAILILALIPHIRPQLLDLFFSKNELLDRGYTEFGGYLGKFHGGFLPTGETVMFILSGNDLESRLKAKSYFDKNHPFSIENILFLNQEEEFEPQMSAPLLISQKYLSLTMTCENSEPSYSVFPAKKIETSLEWEDLIIEKEVKKDIDQILSWIEHGSFMMNELGLSKKVKPGYRSLFYGPPGTGKTLTACLLAKTTGKDVYRVDLSIIVSKYIGETEKNLARIFDYAERHEWILFFDEADALFGKRSSGSSANDRFANQEISYLLQRIEDFPGVIILASNLKSNIDEAFSRRFQSMIYFGVPNQKNRHRIWSKIFDGPLKPEVNLDLSKLAADYEISGGSAINVYRYSALRALQRKSEFILKEDVIQGVQKEFQKEGRTI
ncbi:MAG: ATP-binding protein [Reichenbachiella sp.]|uniref:ATP-binding protein n=1 Tax=Reichenbachiella sp. TaxID=2184521 RepID=UPI0029663778|nr:ATP-binding protein [Reichenbachiella sp.]MDW3211143.1 ATP-binding protein [Reichenbachiella sp.]